MDIDFLSRFLSVTSTLFVIIDPLAAAPTFLSLTADYSDRERASTAFKACLFGALSLLAFSLVGAPLFDLLSLNMNAFKAGGGLLLLLTALDMLRANHKECGCSRDELGSAKERDDISFVPLAMPMLAGPGAITSVMIFSTDNHSSHTLNFLVIATAVVLIFLVSFFLLKSSVLLQRSLGKSGISVIQRVMGLLLAALSLQMIAEGAVSLIKSLT